MGGTSSQASAARTENDGCSIEGGPASPTHRRQRIHPPYCKKQAAPLRLLGRGGPGKIGHRFELCPMATVDGNGQLLHGQPDSHGVAQAGAHIPGAGSAGRSRPSCHE